LTYGGQWSYVPVISKGNQARLRENRPMSQYTITVSDLAEIAATTGLDHAEFCIQQMESQDGSEVTQALWVELARLRAAKAEA